MGGRLINAWGNSWGGDTGAWGVSWGSSPVENRGGSSRKKRRSKVMRYIDLPALEESKVEAAGMVFIEPAPPVEEENEDEMLIMLAKVLIQ